MWEAIKLVTSNIWQFIKPFLVQFLTSSGRTVLQIALTAVINAQTSGGTGAEKRQTATDAIIEELKKQGLNVGTSMINSAIEVAVQKIKSDT